ncbi:MAG: HPr family phosphocarrier protein [Clostridiaceae bacterium]|jgi:phosphocarrier protein|nr:HPr family phosphocarrier protein [Clostridiaceae bacterium]
MVSEKVTVCNKSGLHMRPAAVLSQLCAQLKSDILLVCGDKEINPKSILKLMGCGIRAGDVVEVRCDGPTEEKDLQAVVEAIQSGLGDDIVDV